MSYDKKFACLRRFDKRNAARLNADGDTVIEEPSESMMRFSRGERVSRYEGPLSSAIRARMEFLPSTSSDLLDRDIDEIEERLRQEPEDEVRYFGTSEPYYVCPLPIPLERKKSSSSPDRHSLSAKFATITLESTLAAR